MRFLLLTFLVLVTGCRPSSYEVDISNGYVLQFIRTNDNYISYRGDDKEREIVVDSNVEQYYLNGDFLYISRRPRNDNQKDISATGLLSDICEYWVVNVKSHIVKGPFSFESLDELAEWKMLREAAVAQKIRERNTSLCPLIKGYVRIKCWRIV